MKDKILFAIALMCTMLLTSCGGGGDSATGGGEYDGGNTPSRPSTYNMNVIIEASAYTQTTTLDKLSTNIATATCSEGWVTLTRNAYSSGSPKITIDVTENTSTSSRSCVVTVTATDGNIVKINITQNGKAAVTPSTYNMDVAFEASGGSKTMELTDIKTAISTATSSGTWVTWAKQSYTSGSPKIKISASANTSTASRSCTVTVVATNDDIVKINITQKGKVPSGNPETNDEVSDQQPYSMDIEVW